MTDTTASGKRRKRVLLLAVLAASGLLMLAWSQVWFTLPAIDGTELAAAADVRGAVAAPPLMALGLAGLAATAGLALAGLVLRWVLGGLVVVLGGTAVLTSSLALADPVRAAARLVTDLTGVAGEQSTSALIDPTQVGVTPIGWLGVLGGALLAAAGVLVIATAKRWPSSARRFETRFAEADSGAPVDSVEQWDALTGGDDPTEPGEPPRGDRTDDD